MLQTGRVYEVRDHRLRLWGTVLLQWEQKLKDISSTLSGQLKPAPEFDDVRSLFARYDELVGADSDIKECRNLRHAIAELNVELIDIENRERNTVGIVFVSDNLLFTCEQPST